MKKLVLIAAIFVPFIGFSQADSVTIGANYIYQTYYSFSNGTVKTSSSDWDLAFGIGGFNVDIRTNDGHSVTLYSYPNGDTSAWNNIDTTGLHNWTSISNDENYWDEGAFNLSSLGHPDYGWGVYNSISHNVEGDSLFIIQTKAGNYKKLRIDGMYINGTFVFTYADLDGNNEISATVTKTNYTGKNFVYYSIDNDSVMDLEPMAEDWDIVFNKYTAVYPTGGYYNVTGIQTNKHRTTAEARQVDLNTVDWNTLTFTDEIGVIGWDWKDFNMNTFSYDIEDSLTYFVADTNNNIWQITMTGYEYPTGTFYFNKTRVNGVSVQDIEKGLNTVNVFPNPATDNITISIEAKKAQNELSVTIFNLTGQTVWNNTVNVVNQSNITVPVTNWKKGIYIVRIGNDHNAIVKQLVIQ